MLDAAVQRSQTDPQAGGEIRLRAFPTFQEFAQAGILVIDALTPAACLRSSDPEP